MGSNCSALQEELNSLKLAAHAKQVRVNRVNELAMKTHLGEREAHLKRLQNSKTNQDGGSKSGHKRSHRKRSHRKRSRRTHRK